MQAVFDMPLTPVHVREFNDVQPLSTHTAEGKQRFYRSTRQRKKQQQHHDFKHPSFGCTNCAESPNCWRLPRFIQSAQQGMSQWMKSWRLQLHLQTLACLSLFQSDTRQNIGKKTLFICSGWREFATWTLQEHHTSSKCEQFFLDSFFFFYHWKVILLILAWISSLIWWNILVPRGSFWCTISPADELPFQLYLQALNLYLLFKGASITP